MLAKVRNVKVFFHIMSKKNKKSYINKPSDDKMGDGGKWWRKARSILFLTNFSVASSLFWTNCCEIKQELKYSLSTRVHFPTCLKLATLSSQCQLSEMSKWISCIKASSHQEWNYGTYVMCMMWIYMACSHLCLFSVNVFTPVAKLHALCQLCCTIARSVTRLTTFYKHSVINMCTWVLWESSMSFSSPQWADSLSQAVIVLL